jgi:AraC-like DNA-binding protein
MADLRSVPPLGAACRHLSAQVCESPAGTEQNAASSTLRAASHAAMIDQVRRHIEANLYEDELSPESVLSALRLPRSSLYRLFKQEGGLGAYIRQCRLRQAADDLIRYPHMMVMEIAYGLGFKSASVFTRAFRRDYGMAPQDFRISAGVAARAGGA